MAASKVLDCHLIKGYLAAFTGWLRGSGLKYKKCCGR
ncbi:SEC-C metal-binding domain-containing protein [Sphingobium sp. AP50]